MSRDIQDLKIAAQQDGERIRGLERLAQQDGENIRALARIAEIQERRPTYLQGDE